MFMKILSWLTGGGLSAIGKQLNRAYQSKLDAKNNEQRIEADVEISQLHARQVVLIAEQGNWLTRLIRPAFAFPFIAYNFKIIVYDKMLGWGVTDPLSKDMIYLEMIVFGFYFLTRGIEKSQRRK